MSDRADPSGGALVRWLPAPLRKRMERRPALASILDNIGWLAVDRVLRMGVGLLVGVWLARYLGPAQYGQFNYALACLVLAAPLAGLGLNSIVVRDLVREPAAGRSILGTAFVLQFAAGAVAALLVAASVAALRPGDDPTIAMVGVLSLTLVFRSTDVVKYWFDSRVESRYAVWVESAAFLAMAAVKVAMILSHAGLMAFVWVTLAEAAACAAGLLAIYAARGGRPLQWQPGVERARRLMQHSWPLMLSGLSVAVYMGIDQVMLGQMLGPREVGIYGAATRLSEVWYFIPMVVVASFFPAITKAKETGESAYLGQLQTLYDMLTMMSLVIAVAITVAAPLLVSVLFGPEFAAAAGVLQIHVWTGVFAALGVASSCWYVNENLQQLAFQRTLWGALFNVVGNFYLIPAYGAAGAAVATLLSQAIAAYLFDAVGARTRMCFRMKTRSFLAPLRFAFRSKP
ncbi:flippase [Ramlibacter sp.]|uniref:flippase n=1 Tax=Ramlibacter sp. TaxID=1917967 RepID=UPI002C78AA1B|nr:flippase [Ramlibacter sp.]HWI83120.1 flippase [Ramlibacter sp.]